MSIKLIAIDIDGTLINDERKILPETKAAIKSAQKKGIKVVLVTGRPLTSTIPYLDDLGLNNKNNEYVSTFHGAVISTTKGEIISEHNLSFNDFLEIENYSRTANSGKPIFMMFQTPEYIYTTCPNLNLYAALESEKNLLPIRYRSLDELIKIKDKLNLLKFMYSADKNILDNVQRNLSNKIISKYSVIRSEPYYLDFINKNVNKGWAIKEIAQHLHILPEEIMAIGNANNDIEMIKFAGMGVAVKNATDDLLKIAQYVTDSNNKNGVGKIINKVIDD